jgi:hypothetical protein
MRFFRIAAIAASAMVLCTAFSLRADTVEVYFSGTIYLTDTPGISTGQTFSGGFSYSTTDTFEGSSGGLSSYSLTSPEDTLFFSVGGSTVTLGTPLSGVTANVGLAPLSFDPDPDQDYFAIEADSNAGTVLTNFDIPGYQFAGLSAQLIGNTNFLSSDALPDPFNTSDVTFGLGSVFSSTTLYFSDQKGDVYFSVGEITQISTTPEPRGAGLAALGIAALALLIFSGAATASRS